MVKFIAVLLSSRIIFIKHRCAGFVKTATLARSRGIDRTPNIPRTGVKLAANVTNQITDTFEIIAIAFQWYSLLRYLPHRRKPVSCFPNPRTGSPLGFANHPQGEQRR